MSKHRDYNPPQDIGPAVDNGISREAHVRVTNNEYEETFLSVHDTAASSPHYISMILDIEQANNVIKLLRDAIKYHKRKKV